MKCSLAFLALAATALASKEVRNDKHGDSYPTPTVTYHKPDVTESKKVVEYTTLTSLCPYTVTKTVGGSTVCITYYSTSTIVKEVPTEVPVYVTSVTTEYKTEDVYTTTTCPVVTYTTVIAGSTICITETHTKTITYSSAYTVTEVIPVTVTKDVEETVAVTVGGGETVTQESVTYVYVSSTISQTFTSAPPTVVVPTTATSTTSSGPVTAAAVARDAPAVALVAGIVGAIALL